VTDDQGVSARDTLFVDVDATPEPPDPPEEPDTEPPAPSPPEESSPEVPVTDTPGVGGDACPDSRSGTDAGCTAPPMRLEIVGPSVVIANRTATYRVRVSNPKAEIVSRQWNVLRSDDSLSSGRVTASGKTVEKSFTGDDVGQSTVVMVTVRNSDGETTTATRQVEVRPLNRQPVVTLVGPSVVREDATNRWRVQVYNANVREYNWNIDSADNRAVSKSWNIPNPQQQKRTETVEVTVVLADGSTLTDSLTVVVRQFQRRNNVEIDQTRREGFEGLLRDVHDLLAGERRQMEFGSGDYYYREELERMQLADSVDPDTTMFDDYDPGVLDVVSTEFDRVDRNLLQSGNELDGDITSTGAGLEAQLDEKASGVRTSAREAGTDTRRSIANAGNRGNHLITDTGSDAADVAADAIETGIESSALSADNNPAGTGISDKQAKEFGRATGAEIRSTGDSIGDAYERGSQALGRGTESAIRAGGRAASSTLERGGDVVRAGADIAGEGVEAAADSAGDGAEFISDVANGADEFVDNHLPGDDGMDGEAREQDSSSDDGSIIDAGFGV
jgi:hypothetical protein